MEKVDLEKLYENYEKDFWPIRQPKPMLFDGGKNKKPLTIYLNEREWNTIDKHTKALGVPKSVWMKYAIWSAIEEEQKKYFLK